MMLRGLAINMFKAGESFKKTHVHLVRVEMKMEIKIFLTSSEDISVLVQMSG